MKKLSLFIAFFAFAIVFAQKKHPKKPTFTTDQKIQLMVKKMEVSLDLSEKQVAKITPIIAAKAQKREAKIAAHKANREQRKTLSADEKFTMAMNHLKEQQELQAQMKSILNKTQYAQWRELQKKHHKAVKQKIAKAKHQRHAKKKHQKTEA